MSESALSVDTSPAANRGPLISWFAVVAVTMGGVCALLTVAALGALGRSGALG